MRIGGLSMKGQAKIPNCWICNDQGMIIYVKSYNNMEYEFSYRCKCKLGQDTSHRIKEVPDGMVEKLAERNFDMFKKFYPQLVMKLG